MKIKDWLGTEWLSHKITSDFVSSFGKIYPLLSLECTMPLSIVKSFPVQSIM